jgi:outer membrane lipoprotein-sorting protein
MRGQSNALSPSKSAAGVKSAANLSLSCKIHAVETVKGYRARGGKLMIKQFKHLHMFPAPQCAILGAVLSVAAFGCMTEAFGEGGQTEVSKTTPSYAPSVQSPAVQTPSAQQAAPAVKPTSPVGSGAQWQTNAAQPSQAAPQPAAPLQESEAAVITKVNNYFNKLTDLQGIFTQTDPDNRQKRGRFYFQRPGKIRFDYAPPSGLRIISDGRNLAIEDHDLNTTERYPLDVTPFRLLLSETVDLANDAKILGVEQGPDLIILTAEDKNGDGSGRIRLFFNRADMSLKEWIITDAQGLDTRIEVSNLEQNKKVAENFFIISPFNMDRDR